MFLILLVYLQLVNSIHRSNVGNFDIQGIKDDSQLLEDRMSLCIGGYIKKDIYWLNVLLTLDVIQLLMEETEWTSDLCINMYNVFLETLRRAKPVTQDTKLIMLYPYSTPYPTPNVNDKNLAPVHLFIVMYCDLKNDSSTKTGIRVTDGHFVLVHFHKPAHSLSVYDPSIDPELEDEELRMLTNIVNS